MVYGIDANAYVLVGILALMLALYAHAFLHGSPSVLLYSRHASAASSFWFYFATVCCLLITYLRFRATDKVSFDNSLGAVPFEVIGDFGSLCTLAAAWAYSRAKDFSLPNTLGTLCLALGFLTVWYVVWRMIAPTPTLLLVLLQAAPGITLAIVSTVALGWVFFVRWGGVVGGLYLFFRIAYSVLQMPANIKLYIGDYLDPKASASLDVSFEWLAGGKIVLAIVFLSLLCRSDFPGAAIEEPKYVPDATVRLDRQTLRHVIRDNVIALALGVMYAPIGDKMWHFLARFLGGH